MDRPPVQGVLPNVKKDSQFKKNNFELEQAGGPEDESRSHKFFLVPQ
jgi:hypothetical protein